MNLKLKEILPKEQLKVLTDFQKKLEEQQKRSKEREIVLYKTAIWLLKHIKFSGGICNECITKCSAWLQAERLKEDRNGHVYCLEWTIKL
ncbi:MAG: hypothetical protein QXI58_06140 [Candidatus Micrarchaeia archaeon]